MAVLFFSVAVVAGAHTLKEGTTIIHMTKTGFDPERIEIKQGDTVVFENGDDEGRWPASNIHPTHSIYPGSDIRKCDTEEEENIFDSCGPIEPGESYSVSLDQAGTWKYHDHLHPQFGGEIAVLKSIFFTSDKNNNKEQKKLKGPVEYIKRLFAKLYFQLFPHQLQEVLDEHNFYSIAYDDDQLKYWLQIAGQDVIFDAIIEDAVFQGEDEALRINCHLQAHLAGKMAYNLFEKNPFANIDSRCNFGFFHGALENFVREITTEDDIADIFTYCASFKDPFLLANCEHGIGHGFTVSYNYDLPKAVNACATAHNRQTRSFCYHGAFMENTFTGLGFASDHASDWIREDDMDFPCTYFADRQEFDQDAAIACYFNQSFLWGNVSPDFDFQNAINGCLRAPEKIQNKCFIGLSFDYAFPPIYRDNKSALRACEQVPSQFYDQCIAGIILVRTTAWEGFDYDTEKQTFCTLLQKSDLDACDNTFDDILSFINKRN